jgi:hypothetical protein
MKGITLQVNGVKMCYYNKASVAFIYNFGRQCNKEGHERNILISVVSVEVSK